MSRPLFFCSSKPASTLVPAAVGQAHVTSSSGGTAGDAPALTDDDALRGALAALAAATGAEAAEAGGKLRGALASAVPGAATRSTCPTSMTFGLSRPFQRAMSRQF